MSKLLDASFGETLDLASMELMFPMNNAMTKLARIIIQQFTLQYLDIKLFSKFFVILLVKQLEK